MANSASPEQNQNHCSAINSSILLTQGNFPTLTLSGKIRVTVTFFLFLLSTAFNASFLLKLQKWTQRKEKGKKLSRMKVLLKHLTLANLLETLIVMPLDGMWNITVQWYAGEFLCKVLSYLKLFSMYAPAFMMVVISLDRSLAITRPLAVKSNSRLGRFMIGLAWLLSSIFAGPQLYIFRMIHLADSSGQTEGFSQCVTHGSFPQWWHQAFYNFFTFSCLFIIPLLIMLICNAKIMFTLTRVLQQDPHNLQLNQSKNNIPRARLRTLKMTVAFAASFIVCWTPYYVLGIWCHVPSAFRLRLYPPDPSPNSAATATTCSKARPSTTPKPEARTPLGLTGRRPAAESQETMEGSQPVATHQGEEASCSSWGPGSVNTNLPIMPTESVEIDDALYSRQRYVLGDTAMQKMARSHVFLSGMGGLGLEIAKNLVLAGIKALTIHDTEKCQAWDLGTNFFLCEDDVVNSRNRAEAVLQHIAELNPYVHVTSSSVPLNESTDLSFLDKYQCVVLTEIKLPLRKKINDFCRSQCPPIKFICADVHGVWSRLFCDFGDEFEVLDTTGEEPKEIFISNITQANPGIVTCLENHPHKLETGQFLTFREINGMTGLNGSTQQITVISPFSFSIGDTTGLEPYLHGGIAVQVKTPKTFCFEPLEKQIKHPKCLIADFSKPEASLEIHSAMLALDQFQENYSRKPNIGCQQDSKELLKLATSICETLEEKPEVNNDIVRWLSWTAQGFLPPLAATVGGLASQEVLKAVTGKFSPLCQWLYIEAADIVESLDKPEREEFLPRGDRYDALRACIGDTLCQKLQNLNIFLVGCGAIGCEMLKNFALLGVGTGKEKGMVTVTDPDLIEKSNLNRQFLFRPHHIQKPKSYTAADATLKINPQLKIDAHLNKVCSATEAIYNDEFYTKQDIIITALDNVEARRYVDSRCLANLRPLLDSGTMGTKGHTEVIVPHLTESYNSHRDPPEEEIPFCTLKSFPAAIEHTIQWARDKFESSFSYKPSLFNKFWQTYSSAEEVLQKIQTGHSLEGCFQVIKLLSRRPRNWTQCVELARLKFEKYFNHKALQLLHCFPLDTRLKDGSLFWQSPKRPPSPLKFDLNEPLLFLDLSADTLLNILSEVKIQEFKPSNKVVQTDETARKPDHVPISSEDERNAIFQLEKAISSNEATASDLQMAVLSFEKDDDRNGHIDFITAASNLRAKMYSIEPADRLKTKRIAGRIIPAIATSTAAVSGLVALEMIKVAGDYPFEAYKNCFLNLAIPIIVFTETSEVRKTEIRNGISFTIWDRWTIHGKEDFTLLDFINAVKEKYGIEPTMVVQGVKMLYVPVMPGHAKRLKLTMHKLVKPSTEKKYVDLTVSFAPDTDGDEDLPGPPVRYYFSHDTD
uniref:Gonadotropin-releasing hormone receptor n=1 Tax=Sus scrofa TaxID=9823 RepID=A0A8D2BUJ7_PIG